MINNLVDYIKPIKELIPPIIIRLLNSLYGWKGNYATWTEVPQKASGYDSIEIVEKVKDSLLRVKNNEAKFERDSVLFYEDHFSFPLLTCLFLIASQNNNSLNIIDFGGSLGSTYFRNKNLLDHLSFLQWNIIEQPIFVDYGKKYFENDTLKFYENLDECLGTNKVKVILFSSVIQYIEKPYELLHKIIDSKIEYILFDRTPFIEGDKDHISLQKNPPFVYKTTYPCWIFNRQKFLQFILNDYEQLFEFKSIDDDNRGKIEFKGFLFKKKKNV